MYATHEIGDKLTVIDHGKVPKKFRDRVKSVKKALRSRSTRHKMLTFLFHEPPPGSPQKVWVALSGAGT